MVAAKRRQKELALALNATKGRIDALRQQQEELKAARLAEGGEAAQVGLCWQGYLFLVFCCSSRQLPSPGMSPQASAVIACFPVFSHSLSLAHVRHTSAEECLGVLPCGCRR
jgi:hypothetical protein